MSLHSSLVRRFLDNWPGKRRFGIYRFLPIFFGLGAALEYSMINWTVGETNFCRCDSTYVKLLALKIALLDRTFKRRQAKNYVEDQAHIGELQQQKQTTQ
ncbi:hypothetical protein KR093_010444 [Drosophila rubida]|uniref:Small integral membrane protein 4 n=1 Tax=Drosophila rubida TaxID=30044 RepID=A0AAD4KFE7_9MUSC|nr:hypothetical protein KR093_010444 [Drosophila rubida]